MVLVENFVSEKLDPHEFFPPEVFSEKAIAYIDTATEMMKREETKEPG